MEKILFKVNSVNTGTQMEIFAQQMRFTHKNFNSVPQETSKAVGSAHDYRLPSFTYQGHDSPLFVVQAKLFTDDNTSNRMTLGWLGSFARCGSIGYIFEPYYRTFEGIGSLPVIIDSIDMSNSTQTMAAGSEGYAVDYSINFRVVRP